MKSHRAAAFLALIVLLGLVAPLSAESARPAAPKPDFLSPVFAASRPGFCPTFYCPIYYPNDCSCEWITCPDGSVACGRWNGTAAASSSSTAPAALPFAPAVQAATGGQGSETSAPK
ncbi:MAG: hypothetical protein QOF89_4428 [Acidobacteriota bacterium]|jgi:hypothetical protein|nr:hypothetical protein [Acidobacteriota bacterium]